MASRWPIYVCPKAECGLAQFPDGVEEEDGPPECNHGMFFEDPSLGASADEMERIEVMPVTEHEEAMRIVEEEADQLVAEAESSE